MRTFFLSILAMITAAAVITIAWKPMFGWHRPYVNWAPWDLAQYLVDNERNPRECLDLIFFEIMAPQQGEQRALCIFEYAKIAKDPLSCELLRPGIYAQNCIGAATEHQPCLFKDDKTVVWNDGKYNEEPYDLCNGVASDMGSKCCAISKSKFDPDFTACDTLGIEDAEFMDLCWDEVATKKLDVSFCSNITSENLWSACNVRIKALQEIRS